MSLPHIVATLRRFGRVSIAAVVALAMLPIVLLTSSNSVSAGPEPVFTMFVPFTEEAISEGLFSILTSATYPPSGTIVNQITVTAAADNTILYWDHWEDGYESDIANPPGGSTTEIWGDGDLSTGAAPGVGTNAADVLNGGDVVTLQNNVPIPRNPANQFYDGRDKVAATRGIVMTRAGWDLTLGTVHAGAVAAPDLSKFGTHFAIPIGENIFSNEAFEYTAASIMASADGTVLKIDSDGDGSFDLFDFDGDTVFTDSHVMNQGESVFVDGGMSAGGGVETSKPAQVHLLTGDVGSLVSGRWYEVFPDEVLDDEYVAAAQTTNAGNPVSLFVHNPGDATIDVGVDAVGTANDTTLTIVAGGTEAFNLPNGSGAQLTSPGNNFSAVSATVALAGNTTAYDWGYTLVPASSLTSGIIVGWGAGNPGNTEDGSPVWIAPLDATDLHVDYDGDGVVDNVVTGVQKFESVKIVDADHDMTGARVFSPTGVLLSAAWGQDPDVANTTNAYDLGTAILPVTSLVVTKSSQLVIDVNSDGRVNPGDTLEYTVRAVDAGALQLTDVVVLDDLPSTLTYVPGTTTVNGVSISDDGTGSTAFPVDESGVTVFTLLPGEAVDVSYRVQLANPFPVFTTNVRNTAIVTSQTETSQGTSIVPVEIPDLYIAKTSNAPGPLLPGQTYSYDVEVANTSVTPQNGIDVSDTLPADTTWVSTNVTRPVDDPSPGGTATAADDFETMSYANNPAQWTTTWTETDAAGAGPTVGNVRIANELLGERLRLEGPSSAIRRSFDATGFKKAILTFDYRRSNLEVDDYASFEISTTGGSSWIELDRFEGAANDASYQPATYDLTRFTGQPIALRWVTSSGFEVTNDRFFFDNVDVALTKRIDETVAGAAPPAVYSGGELLTEESLTVTVTVELDASIDPSIDSITNTAETLSIQSPTVLQSTAIDAIARASIGNTVWEDVDGDGIVDPGEPRFPGIQVSLYDAGSTLIGTAMTNASGLYQFAGLDPGDYIVAVTGVVPAGMTPVSDADGGQDETTDVTVGFGENNTATNFGYATPVSLGDRVFADIDGNAIENGLDFGLDGLPVTITGMSPNASHQGGSSTTTSGGFYEFTNLLPGTYDITLDTTSLSPSSYSTTGGSSVTQILVSGTDVDTVDFGYVIPASIGDLVWHDLDADGVLDVGEPGFAGVDVTVTGPGLPVGGLTQSTDANGYYLFSNLDAGTFTVSVAPGTGDLPVGYTSSTGTGSVVVTVAADDIVDTVDFGFHTQASIGDFVFDDLNGDGDQDPGEPGLEGVTVTLDDGTTQIIATTGTGANAGQYDFIGLDPGTYTVTVDASGFPIGTINTLNGATPSVTVASSDDIDTADFGFLFPATFGDFVFHDLNGNGSFDSGEPGIDGVELTLTSPVLGTPLTATTASGGQYLFSGLAPGTYTVTLTPSTLPTGYAISTGSNTATQAVASGSNHLDADFGAHTTADIGDFVFHDLNADGAWDSGEPALSGVQVTLTGGGLPPLGITATTDAGGNYLFTDLDPGTYTVTADTATVPSGYLVTAGNDTRTTTLVSDGDDLTLDFGYATTTSIGDFVYDDLNGDGIQNDGAASLVGIENVDVTITGTSPGASHPAGLTMQTGPDGDYLFDALAPGTYTVAIAMTGVLAGAGNTEGGTSQTVTVVSDTPDLDVDFGVTYEGSIGDLVFDDANGNGTFDTGEVGFDGVTVTLTGPGLPVGGITTVTDASGNYTFTGLEPGTYTATLTLTDLPAGVVNTVGGTSQVITIASGQDDDTIDFGFYVPSAAGDLVFDDANGNGVFEPGDAGIDGITITLYSGTSATPVNLITTVDTAGGGSYSFPNLAPGTYTVEIDTADLGVADTITTAGGSTTFTTTITSGTDDFALDFGVARPITIGDFVFDDLNGNGAFDVGEPGIDGVDVTITGTTPGASHSSGLTIATVNGFYEFDSLLPGDYAVTIDVGSGPAGSVASTLTTVAATYSSGDDVDTVDFGLVSPTSIGDLVFEDLNGNGAFDTGEPGLAGVTLELSGPGVPPGTNVITGASGAYSFDDLTPGTYTVSITGTPAGFTNTVGGTSQTTTITSGNGDDTVYFGFYLGASIGDTIFDDLNGDGVQDPGEPGLDNVTVTLTGGSLTGPITADTGTGGTGAYDFVGLEPGTYTVTVTGGLPAGAVNTLGGASQSLTVASGDDTDTVDFGYYAPGSIGDFVWDDVDGNGLQDDGPTGIGAVTMTLTGTTGAGAITPIEVDTDVDGAYAFTGLAPGTYAVSLDIGDLAPGAASTTGGFVTSTIVIESGQDEAAIDFGVADPAAVGDLMFNDNDGTGTFTAGDTPLVGVTVTLTGTNAGGAITPVTDVTDASGIYGFGGLLPGSYTVTVSTATGTLSGDEFSTTGGDTQSTTLISGETDDTLDFGYAQPASIGDTLFHDANANGVQDGGDLGIALVDVTITGTTPGASHAGGFTIETGPTGAYAFTDLLPGSYTITVDTGDAQMNVDFVSTTGGDTQTRALVAGQNIDDADFGYTEPVTIGDFVFTDDDADGSQSGDVGLGGVDLELRDGLGDVVATTTSNATTGAYSFDGVLPGAYTVVVTGGLPAGAFSTTGGDTQSVTVTSGNDDLTLDFGYAQPAAIGDQVYNDVDADGSFSGATDLGYAATVTVTGPSHPTGQSFATAPDGTYSIGGLIPGSYDVAVSGLPAGATRTEGSSGYTIVLGSNDTDNSADFGFWTTGSIGDFVFEDMNGDGIRDVDDVGYAGVTLELTGPGVPAGTTFTTDSTGVYTFANLAPGTYTVAVITAPSGAVNTLGGPSQTVTIGSGEIVSTVDFAFSEPSTIGDYVWDDLDGNGLQDDGAPGAVGISGVTVTLTGGDLAGPVTQTTGASGDYAFAGLLPGTYEVALTTTDLVAGAASTTGGFTNSTIVVTSASTIDTVDFGVANPADLGDLVFEDVDGNGVYDVGTDGLLEGVAVTVTGTSAGASFPAGTTVTTGTAGGGDAGEYGLGGLLPGSYTVTVATGTGDLASNAISSTGGTTQTLTLVSGQTDLDVDFGFTIPAWIGDQLFVDNNANGVFDAGDLAIADVDVTLTGPGQGPSGTTISSDPAGAYLFSNLAPGTYTVTVDVADPDFLAVFGAGTEISTTGGASRTLTIGSNATVDTIDFGWYEAASIGDLVFDDLDGDGLQDPGEPGIEGITVTLSGGDLTGPITTTTGTGPTAGEYGFAGLTPGDYLVTAVVPGQTATTPGGTAQAVSLTSRENDDTVDFGFAAPASVGDSIFDDLDGDGVQDLGEPGLGGVTVTLTGGGLAGPITTSTATGASAGDYGFSGLAPGSYTVTVTTGDLPNAAYASTTGGDSSSVTLSSGEDDDTIDFGYASPATIGDLVFDDQNGDGIHDVGEPGFANVVVRITGGGLPPGGIVDTTDINGAYSFSNLDPGTYTINIESGLPVVGVRTLNASGVTVTVVSDEAIDTVDFGAYVPTSIGDLVFVDENGNGSYNGASGDTVLPGVTVTLTGGGLTVPLTDVTDASGNYGFDNLAPGEYTVTLTAGIPVAHVSTTGGNAINVTVISRTPDLTLDFGLTAPISIGDLVWHDLDASGTVDAGEPGLDGVQLELVDGNGVVVDTATTASGGVYTFANVMPDPLDYTVRIVTASVPAGYAPTTPETFTVTATSGDDIDTVDVGYATTGSIGDYVWDDLDGNGLQDDGAAAVRGISGVTVTLTGAMLATPLTDITDANGAYLFDNLEPGVYLVTVATPAGATSTTGGDSVGVGLLSNQAIDIVDFGYAYGASIGDRIWHDLDANGVDDAEPGLGGVEVLLDGNGVSMSDTTDGNGTYLFTGLTPGEYTITVNNSTVPAGAISGAQLTPTTAVSTTLTVGSGDVVDSVDYGYATTAIIGDTIFDDLDGDGVLDVLEPGLVGVTVELFDGVSVVATDLTDGNGLYRFTGVAPGSYTVRVVTSTLPSAQYAQTTNPSVAAVTVESDTSDLGVDLGFARPSTIGDFVWHDLDADGVFDAGEPGIVGVKVDLFDGLTLVGSDVTDFNGAYAITGIDPGTYSVQIDPATVPAGANSGSTMTATRPASLVRTVVSGDDIGDADFAFATTATIGDTVWHDSDANGVDDDAAPTEPWLDAIDVQLVDPLTGTVVQTVTTVDGAYQFTGVAPGTWTVRVDSASVPAGYSSTTGNSPTTITVVSDDIVDTIDFGYAQLTGGAIGNEIFDDLDGDGVRQAGEPGIAVTVELWKNGAFVESRTSTGGGYNFVNLGPGDYEVRVDPITVPAGYASSTGGNTQSYTLLSGDAPIDTADFGYVAAASIGDYVWHDLDDDGVQNDGPAALVGLGGITVELRSGATVVDSDVTDTNGAYSLTAPPGTYDVVVVGSSVPDGANSGARMTASTPSTISVTLISNENRTDADFGFVTTASIGDTIFDDLDGDGVQQPGEPGLAGVIVELFDGTTTITVATSATGGYVFDGLAPGSYSVSVDPTTLPVGAFPTTTGAPVAVTVMSDEVVDTVDLGFTTPGTINGEIFTDVNGDGIQTGDPFLDGVTVELLDSVGTVIDAVTTVGGVYTFVNVIPGTYSVRPVLPAGHILTVPNEGTDDAIDSDIDPTTGRSGVITMTSGASVTDVDAGMYELAAIGDVVYVDLNANGTQDAGEPGLAGVLVTVRDDDGNTIGTDTTDANGVYGLDVRPGSHTVTITRPTGYVAGAGGDVQAVTIESGTADLTIDFPVRGANDLSGSVIYDISNDGSIDADDPGLGGVTVTATWNGPLGPVVFTTTTGTNGAYVFTNLPPGDYTVVVDPTTLPDGIVLPTVDPDATIDLVTDLTIGGTSVGDVDFAVSGTASLGDNVFLDANANGVLDAGETGVAGVAVIATVTTSGGVMTYTTVSDANGNYEFTDLPAGTYTITVDPATLPAGMSVSVPLITTVLTLNGIDLAIDFAVELVEGPEANDDIGSTPPSTPVVIPVLVNDAFLPGTTITITTVTDSNDGTVVINDDGTVTYTPDAGFTGTDTFDYTICDLDGLNTAGDTAANRAIFCSTATVTITVPTPPAPPIDPDGPASTTPPTTAAPTGVIGDRPIPKTGSSTGSMQTVGFSMVLIGLGLWLVSRRRRENGDGDGSGGAPITHSNAWPAPTL